MRIRIPEVSHNADPDPRHLEGPDSCEVSNWRVNFVQVGRDDTKRTRRRKRRTGECRVLKNTKLKIIPRTNAVEVSNTVEPKKGVEMMRERGTETDRKPNRTAERKMAGAGEVKVASTTAVQVAGTETRTMAGTETRTMAGTETRTRAGITDCTMAGTLTTAGTEKWNLPRTTTRRRILGVWAVRPVFITNRVAVAVVVIEFPLGTGKSFSQVELTAVGVAAAGGRHRSRRSFPGDHSNSSRPPHSPGSVKRNWKS